MQMQASTWICTNQMQSIKFMSLLPLHVCFSCLRILILLYSSMLLPLYACPCLHSHLPYISLSKTFHIFVQISPPLSSMAIKGPIQYKICAMWRSMDTTWRFYHEHLLWLDAKSWTWVNGWVLNLNFGGHFQLIGIDTTCNYHMWKHEDHLEMPHVCHL